MISLKSILKGLFEAKGDIVRKSGWDKIIDKTKPITSDEYWDLHAEMESNPDENRKKEIEDILSKSYYKYIRQTIANDYRWKDIPMDELLSVAIQEALPKAFDSMKWESGNKFSTHLGWQLLGALTNYKDRYYKVKNTSSKDDEESYIYEPGTGDISLDTAFNFGDGDEGSMHDVIAGTSYDDLDYSVINRLEKLYRAVLKKMGRWEEKWIEYWLFDENGNLKSPEDRLPAKQVAERLRNNPEYGNKGQTTIQNKILEFGEEIEPKVFDMLGIKPYKPKPDNEEKRKEKFKPSRTVDSDDIEDRLSSF